MEFLRFLLLEDALFYWSHRWLHSNQYIYHLFHAYHHQAHKDVTLVNGLQVTFVELFFSLVIPGAIPIFFGTTNRLAFEVLGYVSVFGVICDHGVEIFPSFMIPFPLNGVHHHKRHHERAKGNYSGPLAIWDYVCNTHLQATTSNTRRTGNNDKVNAQPYA